MNILLINTLYYPNIIGGAEKSVQLLAEELASRRHTVVVATIGQNATMSINTVNGVKVYYLPIRNLYPPSQAQAASLLKVIWHAVDVYNGAMSTLVSSLIKEIKPDIVHSHNIAGFSVAVWDAAKARNIPLVHTLRDYYLACPKTTMYSNGRNCDRPCWRCNLFSMGKRQQTSKVDVVTGVSNFILQRHLDLGYFPSSRPAVVFNPYGHQAPGKSGRLVHQGVRFGYIGAISQVKGIELLLSAAASLSLPTDKLHVAGRAPRKYKEYLQAEYSKLSIEWEGFVAPAELFSKINVLIVPSLWHDPAPRVVLEAMSYGIPVIGSARGGIPELIGDAGWVFDPDIPGDLEARMEYVLQNPEVVEEYSQRALERVSKFDIETSVRKYIEIYQSLL